MIKKISIENFGGIELLEMEFCKFNLIQGGNEQGKSTVLQAIEWAIVGGNDDYLIRNGANSCEVKLYSDNGSRIERRMSRGGTNKLFIYKNEEAIPKPQEILNRLYNSAIFSPTEMVRMKPKDLNEFVAEAISSRLKLTKEEIEEYGLGEVEDLATNPIAKITAHRDAVFASRTEVNRNVKMMAAKTVEVVEVDPVKLAELEKVIAGHRENIAKAVENNAKIEIGKKNLVARESTKALIESLTNELKGMNFSQDEVAGFITEKGEKETQFKKVQSELEMDRITLKNIKDALSKIESGTVKCPIFNTIVCTTDMSGYREGLEKEVTDITKTGKKKYTESQKLEKDIKALTGKIELGKDIDKKKLELARAESLYQNLEIADGEIVDTAEWQTKLDIGINLQAKWKLSMEVGKNTGLEDLQKRQVELDNKVKKLDTLLKDVIPGKLKLGVKDVTLSKEGLFFRGLPLYRLADSIKLRICTAILKDLFPAAGLFNLDRMECIDKENVRKYVDYYSKEKNGIQYIASYVGDLAFANNNNVKTYTMKDFKVE